MATVGIILPQQGLLPGPHQSIWVSCVLATGGQRRPAPDIYHLVHSQIGRQTELWKQLQPIICPECLLSDSEPGGVRNEKSGSI